MKSGLGGAPCHPSTSLRLVPLPLKGRIGKVGLLAKTLSSKGTIGEAVLLSMPSPSPGRSGELALLSKILPSKGRWQGAALTEGWLRLDEAPPRGSKPEGQARDGGRDGQHERKGNRSSQSSPRT